VENGRKPRRQRPAENPETHPGETQAAGVADMPGKKRKPMGEFQPVATLNALREGQGITVLAAGLQSSRSFFLKLVMRFTRWMEFCPHKGGPLGEGFCEDGHVHCPMHGWKLMCAQANAKNGRIGRRLRCRCELAAKRLRVAL